MSNWQTWTDEQHQAWAKWLDERPPKVRALAKQFPPYKLFRLKDTHQRVYPSSYNEDGTLCVVVDARFNFVMFERNVFGIKPEDLQECELPSKDEMTGSLCNTEDEVEAVIDVIKTTAKAKGTK